MSPTSPTSPTSLRALYRPSLALLTDLYQLTMAHGHWKHGRADRDAVFHLFFRRNPFEGGYTIAAGLASVLEYLQAATFEDDDLAYLATLRGNDERPLFDDGFLDALRTLRWTIDIDAVPEGTVVFPFEPLVRVTGSILQAQLLETPLLNLINFPSLIATKASRVCAAAKGDSVMEFGARRAQGIDGAVTASRAAYLGGCSHTSNVLAGKLFGIPVAGTLAHSWVMSFDDETEAFDAYAQAMPNNCVFLVDTYDTLDGVRRAVEAGRRLRGRGHEMIGVRLDSGDLAYLSIEARRILDEGGFPKARIVASNDLDEHIIASLKEQGARIDTWGVGTRLATAHDDPALGGVFKLAAMRDDDGTWTHRLKLSEQSIKVTTPGILGVRRFSDDDGYAADVIYDVHDVENGGGGAWTMVDPLDPTRRRDLGGAGGDGGGGGGEDLLIPVVRHGDVVHDVASLDAARTRARDELEQFHAGIRRFVNPHRYPVGLEQRLHDRRTRLVMAARAR